MQTAPRRTGPSRHRSLLRRSDTPALEERRQVHGYPRGLQQRLGHAQSGDLDRGAPEQHLGVTGLPAQRDAVPNPRLVPQRPRLEHTERLGHRTLALIASPAGTARASSGQPNPFRSARGTTATCGRTLTSLPFRRDHSRMAATRPGRHGPGRWIGRDCRASPTRRAAELRRSAAECVAICARPGAAPACRRTTAT
jgi:hypothetical protein